MAHYKRKKCRYNGRYKHSSQTYRRKRLGLKPVKLTDWHWKNIPIDILWPDEFNFHGQTPSAWNIQFHTKPKRAQEKRLTRDILIDKIDAESVAWPVNKKPHIYYW